MIIRAKYKLCTPHNISERHHEIRQMLTELSRFICQKDIPCLRCIQIIQVQRHIIHIRKQRKKSYDLLVTHILKRFCCGILELGSQLFKHISSCHCSLFSLDISRILCVLFCHSFCAETQDLLLSGLLAYSHYTVKILRNFFKTNPFEIIIQIAGTLHQIRKLPFFCSLRHLLFQNMAAQFRSHLSTSLLFHGICD